MEIKKVQFGITNDGKSTDLYTLVNTKGMSAQITNYGATLVSLQLPRQTGGKSDIVLGYDSLADYEQGTAYFGSTVGRYANRIADGTFSIHGKHYRLSKNEGANHLHGGFQGFHNAVWEAETSRRAVGPSITLTYLSRDGEEGYPGNLSATVVYTLTNENELRIDYFAETDQTTVINMTHHSYFNLAGAGSGDILDHVLTIYADQFTPIDNRLIPTGELRDVKGTPMDFLNPHEIGARIDLHDEQLKFGNGYDHNWVLNKTTEALAPAAKVTEPKTGRTLEVFTTHPGMQLYTGNFLNDRIIGKNRQVYGYRGGFCLETQHFPDTPNRPEFPSAILESGQTYEQTTIYRFLTA